MAPTAINLEMRVATLSVGSGEPYSTIAAAVAAAQNGDTIEVQAGTYVNDYTSISKNITLQGVGGMVSVISTGLIPNGKAIFITSGNITINNFEFSGAKVFARIRQMALPFPSIEANLPATSMACQV